jgi:hypothetical protein
MGLMSSLSIHRIAVLAVLISMTAVPALAADDDAAKSNVPQVTGGDIFGFTASTDVGDKGARGGSIELDGNLGKRDGRYHNFTQKYGYEYVFADNWSLGVAFFTAWHGVRNVTVAPINRSMFQFDGGSFEIGHRLIERSETNPFAFKIAIEPRWARLDDRGRRSTAFGAELKFATDAVLAKDRLYWAMNVVLGYDNARDPDLRAKWQKSSEIKVSQALTFQFTPSFLMGAEATYIAAFDGAAFNTYTGHAVFLGPTFFLKLSEKASLNATIAPQIAGRNIATPGQRFDLDNFTRMMTRVKLAVEF